MEEKLFKALMEVKADGEQGLVRAVFATLNVEDSDGDVTLPGAFGNQKVRLGAWGHAWKELPVGKGVIAEEGDKAVFDGGFFLDTDAGREHFHTVKNLAELQEWSYGFKVLESEASEVNGRRVRLLKKLLVHEVSPVMLGAGVDTMTVDIKGTKVWEETENEIRHRLRDPADFQADSFRRITLQQKKPRVFAIVGRLKGETTTTVQSVRFPLDDGWTMAEAKKWMADHPDLAKEADIELITFADHAEHVLADVQAFIERSGSLADLRSKEGRVLSAANRERLSSLHDLLAECAKDIKELLDSTEPEKGLGLLLQFERERARRLGVAV
jgi:hypothetical protein